jgi:hypothetical protein
LASGDFFDEARRDAGFFAAPSLGALAVVFRLRGSADFEGARARVFFLAGAGSALVGSAGDHTPSAECDSALSSDS